MPASTDGKYCPKCATTKDISSFSRNRHRSDGRQYACKPCMLKLGNKSRKKHYKARKAAGICARCPRKVTSGVFCAVCKEAQRDRTRELKLEVFDAYGGRLCACCGEMEIAFLTLDHVKQNGAAHRAEIRGRVYRWLKKNGFPDKDDYQVLCMNCNWGRWVNNGVCPHQEEK